MMKNCATHMFDAFEVWGERAKTAQLVDPAQCSFCQAGRPKGEDTFEELDHLDVDREG